MGARKPFLRYLSVFDLILLYDNISNGNVIVTEVVLVIQLGTFNMLTNLMLFDLSICHTQLYDANETSNCFVTNGYVV